VFFSRLAERKVGAELRAVVTEEDIVVVVEATVALIVEAIVEAIVAAVELVAAVGPGAVELVALFVVTEDVVVVVTVASSHRWSSERHQQYCHTRYRKNQLDAYQYAPPLTGNPQWIAIVADSGTKTGIE
jgi:hypothetical protein